MWVLAYIMRTGWSWAWERLLLFKSGCGSNTIVELHNTKKPLSVSVQPSKTRLLLCSKGNMATGERAGPFSLPTPFHGLRTNTSNCLSWFVPLVCVCRRLSLSSSGVVVNALDQNSFGFVRGKKLWQASRWTTDIRRSSVQDRPGTFFDPVHPGMQDEKSTPSLWVHKTLFSTATP